MMQKNLEMFFQKRKNKDRERHWRSCFWPLFSSGCSSPSGKSAITFLTYRMWNERASCPSVHFLLLIRDSPPGAGLTRYVIPSVCFGPASRVFGQIDVPGTSLEGVGGGEGLQSGNRSDFPTPPQGAVVVLQAHSVSVPREKLYFCCFVSAALSFGSLVSIGGGGYVGMDIYLFHLNKWSNALILSIAYFFFFFLSLATKLRVSTFFCTYFIPLPSAPCGHRTLVSPLRLKLILGPVGKIKKGTAELHL